MIGNRKVGWDSKQKEKKMGKRMKKNGQTVNILYEEEESLNAEREVQIGNCIQICPNQKYKMVAAFVSMIHYVPL